MRTLPYSLGVQQIHFFTKGLFMEIVLQTSKYKTFLTEFRAADRDNAADQETDVIYTEDGRQFIYYFHAKNFQLVAYNIGSGRVNLANYNHVSPMATVNLTALSDALKYGGGGATVMNKNLSTVVALVSEASRSKVVEQALIDVILGKREINLNDYEILFKGYEQPARYCGYLDAIKGYTPNWKPLEMEDYRRFYMSKDYTGNGVESCRELMRLL